MSVLEKFSNWVKNAFSRIGGFLKKNWLYIALGVVIIASLIIIAHCAISEGKESFNHGYAYGHVSLEGDVALRYDTAGGLIS